MKWLKNIWDKFRAVLAEAMKDEYDDWELPEVEEPVHREKKKVPRIRTPSDEDEQELFVHPIAKQWVTSPSPAIDIPFPDEWWVHAYLKFNGKEKKKFQEEAREAERLAKARGEY